MTRRFGALFDPALLDQINRQVNATTVGCAEWYRGGVCTDNWNPAPVGDCKQFAANKLALLLQRGADPKDFVIWIVRGPDAKIMHAVLMYKPTGKILDVPGAYVCSTYGCQRSSALKTRKLMEHDGYIFLEACDSCTDPAVAAASTQKEKLP